MADVHTRKASVHLEDGQQGGQHLDPRRLQQVLYNVLYILLWPAQKMTFLLFTTIDIFCNLTWF